MINRVSSSFPKGGNSVTFTELNNWIHRSVKIKTLEYCTTPNKKKKQIKPQRKHRLGTVIYNYLMV